MKISKLGAGERHTFPSAALRVELTGSNLGATVQALDVGGTDTVAAGGSRDKRLKPWDLLLVPTPRRLRLTVVPTGGGSFAEGTDIGLTIFTHGGGDAGEQVIVAACDVSALESCELAVLEFAVGRSVLTVTRAATPAVAARPLAAPLPSPVPSDDPAAQAAEQLAPSRFPSSTPQASGVRLLPTPSEEDPAWLRTGRYALRVAKNLGADGVPASPAWALVVDGSISMLRLQASGALIQLCELVSGVVASWTGAYAVDCAVTGVSTASIPDAATDPAMLAASLLDQQPWTSALLAPALARAAQRAGGGGNVIMLCDGVPGDVDDVAVLAGQRTDLRVMIVTTGTSRHGLPTDVATMDWWQEELSGFDGLVGLPNVRLVAVRTTAAGDLLLPPEGAAEMALRLTSAGSSG